ncbi:hypothetical protein F2Q69_00042211 [Brassica cretica]|uniref:Uncharacterized protein n=1 Tax=Brassica cretica TaxID=69181 RepID=A0A8S9NF07_BRACR|nr:hypothetical protein F2Q69_00042211 [Brassica cretica]
MSKKEGDVEMSNDAGASPSDLPAAGASPSVLPAAGENSSVLPAAGENSSALPAAGAVPAHIAEFLFF